MCIYANSGCNGPIEGECVGLCLHRINTETMTKRCAAIKGNVEQRMPIEFADEPSAFVAAWDAYKTHRPRGRMKALIHAWKRLVRAFRTRHIPDPFKR
jgi:hypothetical protein